MLMRFDPFRELDQLMRPPTGTPTMPLPMDAYRRGEEVIVEIDLPGVDADSIDLTVERDVLQVSARRTPSFGEQDAILAAERPSGEVTRQLFLGEGLDTGRVQASYTDGVLRVVLPVAEEAKPHRISIDRGDGNGHARTVDAKAVSADATS